MSQIDVSAYKEHLSGFNVTDCAVRDKNIFYFVAREDYTKWPTAKWDRENEPPPDEHEIIKRIVVWMRHKEKINQWSASELTGFTRLGAGISIQPKPQFVGVSLDGQVYSIGSGEHGVESNFRSFDEGGPSRGGIRKLRTIDGWLYFCGGNNSVGKRLGKNEWFSHSHAIPDPKRTDHRHNTFDDIDGFGEQDIYCVGQEGQVYHYDGKTWKHVPFPSNIDLETVCCAGDGNVYISGKKGMTFKGRGNRWKSIIKDGAYLPFRDMVWYEDRVWCTSDYGVWTIKDDKLASADLPDGMSAYAGNLSTADGVLLLAGYGGAAFLEKGKWTKIFSVAEMSRQVSPGVK